MNIYRITTEENETLEMKADSAGNAIQKALIRRRGRKMISCLRVGAGGVAAVFDIPNHETAPRKPRGRNPAESRPESTANRVAREKPAPWIESWLDERKRAGHIDPPVGVFRD